jgi:hypothetical protein
LRTSAAAASIAGMALASSTTASPSRQICFELAKRRLRRAEA